MSAVTRDMLPDCRTLHRPSTARPRGIMASLTRIAEIWRTRIKDRQAFAALDHRDLRDLRLSRWEVERELAKPFWRG
jgi:uncharacterized protein YjiS (DUF1127 family)